MRLPSWHDKKPRHPRTKESLGGLGWFGEILPSRANSQRACHGPNHAGTGYAHWSNRLPVACAIRKRLRAAEGTPLVSYFEPHQFSVVSVSMSGNVGPKSNWPQRNSTMESAH